jgi:hypothetical protein
MEVMGLMYLRRHVKQPILLRFLAGWPCDCARGSPIAMEEGDMSSILTYTRQCETSH